MKPYYTDDWLTMYGGDCREVLASLPADLVDCVVTSPPYWGLRDYGTEGQLGLERTPEEYVANMVAVFREVRRVLKPSGTCWLNLGDSYATGGIGCKCGHTREEHENRTCTHRCLPPWRRRGGSAGGDAYPTPPAQPLASPHGIHSTKPKDLAGIPWRVAFALQADGWYLRSDIIWSKPNPMPESVTDRPTKSHEYLFLLTKGQWKSRIVDLSDRRRESSHFRDDFRSDSPYAWAGELGVRLATAILDVPEFQQKLSLTTLDAKVGEQGPDGSDSDPVLRLPVEHRAAVRASRVLDSDGSPKEFLRELYGLGITLADRHNLLIGGCPTKVPLPPGVYAYGETSIAIEYPGEVREFDFLHNRIIASTPSTCSYYFDADAVREEFSPTAIDMRISPAKVEEWRRVSEESGMKASRTGLHDGRSSFEKRNPAGRNIRSVWNIATRPYPGAHFAVFPPELPERCIKAGSSEKGVCPECGAPWERVVERVPVPRDLTGHRGTSEWAEGATTRNDTDLTRSGQEAARWKAANPDRELGWRPTCACYGKRPPLVREGDWAPPQIFRPAVILDPFGGSGTVGMVANRLSRRAILIDLNPEYLEQQMKRNAQTPLGLDAA